MTRRVLSLGAIVLLILPTVGCNAAAAPVAPTAPPEPTSTALVQRKTMDLKIDGRILFGKDGDIWLWENGNQKRLTNSGIYRQPQWSPDGTTVAYVEENDSYSNLMVLQPGVSNPSRLTNFRAASGQGGVWVYRPTWSPDGTKLVYVSEQSSYDMNLWMMNADGRNAHAITTFDNYQGGVDSPSWSPDGKQIAFASFRSGVSQVWILTLATGKWQQLTDIADGAYDPAWSPDGTYIAYTARSKHQNDVWIMSADGGGKAQITTDGASRAPTWSPDGQYLAYISRKGTAFDIFAVKLESSNTLRFVTSEPKQLTKGQQVDPVSGLSWTK